MVTSKRPIMILLGLLGLSLGISVGWNTFSETDYYLKYKARGYVDEGIRLGIKDCDSLKQFSMRQAQKSWSEHKVIPPKRGLMAVTLLTYSDCQCRR